MQVYQFLTIKWYVTEEPDIQCIWNLNHTLYTVHSVIHCLLCLNYIKSLVFLQPRSNYTQSRWEQREWVSGKSWNPATRTELPDVMWWHFQVSVGRGPTSREKKMQINLFQVQTHTHCKSRASGRHSSASSGPWIAFAWVCSLAFDEQSDWMLPTRRFVKLWIMFVFVFQLNHCHWRTFVGASFVSKSAKTNWRSSKNCRCRRPSNSSSSSSANLAVARISTGISARRTRSLPLARSRVTWRQTDSSAHSGPTARSRDRADQTADSQRRLHDGDLLHT